MRMNRMINTAENSQGSSRVKRLPYAPAQFVDPEKQKWYCNQRVTRNFLNWEFLIALVVSSICLAYFFLTEDIPYHARDYWLVDLVVFSIGLPMFFVIGVLDEFSVTPLISIPIGLLIEVLTLTVILRIGYRGSVKFRSIFNNSEQQLQRESEIDIHIISKDDHNRPSVDA